MMWCRPNPDYKQSIKEREEDILQCCQLSCSKWQIVARPKHCVCLCDEMLFVCVGDIFPAPNERDKLKQMIIDPRFIRPASVQKFKFIPSFQRWYSYVWFSLSGIRSGDQWPGHNVKVRKRCVCEFRMQFRLFMLGGEGGVGVLFCIKLFFQFIEIFMRKCESILTFAPRAGPVSFIMLGSRGWHWNREWPFEDMLTKLIA